MPTGTVQFKTNGVNLGSAVALSGGSASSAAISSLAVGNYTVTADYSGDASFNTNSGTPAGGQTVSKAGSSTVLTSSVNPSVFGQAVTFNATVTAVPPGAGTPTGTVQFKINGANLGSRGDAFGRQREQCGDFIPGGGQLHRHGGLQRRRQLSPEQWHACGRSDGQQGQQFNGAKLCRSIPPYSARR